MCLIISKSLAKENSLLILYAAPLQTWQGGFLLVSRAYVCQIVLEPVVGLWFSKGVRLLNVSFILKGIRVRCYSVAVRRFIPIEV